MTEQVFHISKAYAKKAKMKNFVLYGTLMFWSIFGGNFVGFLKGESAFFNDVTFGHFMLFAGVMIVLIYPFQDKKRETIKLDAESLFIRKKEKDIFTLYSDIERLVIEQFSNQAINKIQCFYDHKSCSIEGFENMDDIALVLSQNVSEVRKKKVLMIFDSPLFLFVLISGIILAVQIVLMVMDGWFLKA